MSEPEDELRGFASPPCLAHEIDPAYSGLAPVGRDAIPEPAMNTDTADDDHPGCDNPDPAPLSPASSRRG